MAQYLEDDIDIEEHDVMDNPRIKNIFPDIAVLKKEIIEIFDEDEDEPVPLVPSNQKEDPKSLHYDEKVMKENINLMKKLNLPESCNLSPNLSTNNYKSNISFHANRIILGSRPSTNSDALISNHVHKNKQRQLKVIVKDIYQTLKKNKNFCSKCQLLFFHTASMNHHKKMVHFHKICRNSSFMTHSSVKNNMKEKCSKCGIILASRSNLIRHLRTIHELNPKLKCRVKTVSENLGSFTDRKTNVCDIVCSHCNKIFQSASALIEHLYMITKNKQKTGSSVLNKKLYHTNFKNAPVEHIDLNRLYDYDPHCVDNFRKKQMNANCKIVLGTKGLENKLARTKAQEVNDNDVVYLSDSETHINLPSNYNLKNCQVQLENTTFRNYF